MNDAGSRVVEIGRTGIHLPGGAFVEWTGEHLQIAPGPELALLNDVQVQGRSTLQLGDVLAQGVYTFLVLPGPTASAERLDPLDHRTFMARVSEEVRSGTSFCLLLGRSGAFGQERFHGFLSRSVEEAGVTPRRRQVLARTGRELAEVLVTPATSEELGELRERLTGIVNDLGEAVRWGTASSPGEGATAQELWSAALDRLLDFPPRTGGEVPWTDPCLSRVWGLADRFARQRGALGILGEEGVGRETMARGIRRLQAPSAPFVCHKAVRFDPRRWAEDVAHAAGGALHVRHPEILPDRERAAFLVADSFLPSWNLATAGGAALPTERMILVPSLSQRPTDIEPIAEHVLHEVDARLARRRSSLRADARAALASRVGSENVRDLRNAVLLAALSMESSELRADHLQGDSEAAVVEDRHGMREHLRETERRAVQDALRRTGWNVSAAARLMRLPRRTLVYRMAKLSVRRPDR